VGSLFGFSRIIDSINGRIGQYISWLVLVSIVIAAGNAIVRKLFDMSSNAWLEMQWVLFGMVFLLCAPWTLRVNEHIRIDIVTGNFSKKVRDWIDVFGHVFFLLPLCIIMVYHSWPFFTRSFLLNEQSLNAGGLPQWPAKGLVFVGFVLLLFQGLSELIKRIAIIQGKLEDEHAAAGHHAAAEAEAQRLLEIAKAEAEKLAASKP
jgi:TRAP-type mannitol/chloroaromatic compound transport system permease small subunit